MSDRTLLYVHMHVVFSDNLQKFKRIEAKSKHIAKRVNNDFLVHVCITTFLWHRTYFLV